MDFGFYMKEESSLHTALCKWLGYRFPDVIFISEGSGTRVSIGQAVKLKQSRSRGTHLDLYILEPRNNYSGLILELKAAPAGKKDGSGPKQTDHVRDQQAMIDRLRKKGYASDFAIGFDQASKIIESYMDGNYN